MGQNTHPGWWRANGPQATRRSRWSVKPPSRGPSAFLGCSLNINEQFWKLEVSWVLFEMFEPQTVYELYVTVMRWCQIQIHLRSFRISEFRTYLESTLCTVNEHQTAAASGSDWQHFPEKATCTALADASTGACKAAHQIPAIPSSKMVQKWC